MKDFVLKLSVIEDTNDCFWKFFVLYLEISDYKSHMNNTKIRSNGTYKIFRKSM